MNFRALAGMLDHTCLRFSARVLDENRPARNQTAQGISQIESIDVVERHEIDVAQFRMGADRLVSDGQKVSRRQSLLLGTVHRIGLHV